MKITEHEKQTSYIYHRSAGKQFGNLHERMKFAIELARRDGVYNSLPELWQAIHDLETEVSYHEPAKPPYGRRSLTLGTADRNAPA